MIGLAVDGFLLVLHNITYFIIELFVTLSLILQSAFRLLGYIGVGYKWMQAACRLGIFAMLLLPAWWRPLLPYLFSKNILRGIPYGPNTRNGLDIYMPNNTSRIGSRPVAVLVWGGAWTIGYKVWPFILAQELAERGTLCVVIDYRNFPQGNIINMIEDINTAMTWTFNNIALYGGNPEEITLIGQSAGAHLTVLSLLQQVKGIQENMKWDYSRLRHYVGMSGAYDLVSLKPILDRHGLDEVLFSSIMDHDLISNSPLFYLRSNFANKDSNELPPITLVHGTKDKTISSDFTLLFGEELRKFNIQVQTRIFEGKSHTDFFLEDIIEGIGEPFVEFLHNIIHQIDPIPNKNIKSESFTHPIFVRMARVVNPF